MRGKRALAGRIFCANVRDASAAWHATPDGGEELVITRKPCHTIPPDIRADARTSLSSSLERTLLQFEIVL